MPPFSKLLLIFFLKTHPSPKIPLSRVFSLALALSHSLTHSAFESLLSNHCSKFRFNCFWCILLAFLFSLYILVHLHFTLFVHSSFLFFWRNLHFIASSKRNIFHRVAISQWHDFKDNLISYKFCDFFKFAQLIHLF